MGNQQSSGNGKVGVKGLPAKFDDVNNKTSKTNWIAGVASSPGRPTIELSSRMVGTDMQDGVTDEINLKWLVPQDDGGFPITGYRVEMLDIQSGKWVEVTFIEGYEPKCTLSNILYGIMYRFRVVALNDAGSSEPGEPSEPVVIDVPGVQIAPYFVQMLNDTIALEHEKVQFQVRVLGTPKPSIQWYKDDVEIFACDRIEIKEEDEGGAVVLKGARLSDSGVIKCVASNILGRCTSTAQFSIEAAPRFEMPESYSDGLIFQDDENIRLRIPMIAKPAPKIVWFFEDEPISAGSDLIIETTDAYTSLRINGAKRWHCGEFRVYAENEYGEDACSILVTVTSPPSSPGRPVVIDISETKCTLRWEPSEDDGGADVKHYIVEYFRDVWEVWLKAKTTKETIVTIDDLIPGSRYKFRIKSENNYGISNPGDESDPFDVGGVTSDRNETDEISWLKSPTPEITIETTPENELMTPVAPKRKSQNMAKAKQMWGSEEQEEDILDRFLKVKKFQENQQQSHDSDGMPSIAALEDFETNSSQGDANSARRLFAELKSFSNDSNHPDLESVSDDYDLTSSKSDLKRARELYEELREMSVVTGGSIENLMDGINTSNESISSIIPYQKREELSRFEMTLKQMIEEAKQMAATPSGSDEDLYASLHKSPSVISMEESRAFLVESRASLVESRASLVESRASLAESVVSVIEQKMPYKTEVRTQVVITPPPPVEQVETCLNPPKRPPRSPSPNKMRRLSDVPKPVTPQPLQPQQPQTPTQVTPVPVSPVPSPTRLAPSPKVSINGATSLRESEKRDLKRVVAECGTLQRQSRQSSCNKTISGLAPEKPLIGADRYEEIIEASAEARGSRRGSSVASGRRSVQGSMTNLFQPNSTMAMREQTSMSKTTLGTLGSRQGSTNSLNKNGLGTPNELRPVSNELPSSRPTSVASNRPTSAASNEGLKVITPTNIPSPVKIEPKIVKTPVAPTPVRAKVAQEAPPTVAPTSAPPIGFKAKQIEPSIDPLRPETLAEMHAKNPPRKSSVIPDWLIITLTYSAVFIAILLLSNITPNGKLYIHFTAFFSMILYFITDDVDQSQNQNVRDSLMDNFVKVKK